MESDPKGYITFIFFKKKYTNVYFKFYEIYFEISPMTRFVSILSECYKESAKYYPKFAFNALKYYQE